ncbi:hypothetical protein L9F63_026946, partial [Diploptera punctata]
VELAQVQYEQEGKGISDASNGASCMMQLNLRERKKVIDQASGVVLTSSNTLKENGDKDDGAAEKLVGTKDTPEVKFTSTDTQNGDAKIEIEKIAFVGMGKEELMKFANDPFWVRLRWFLFILFWLLWVAMLAGAVAIIVMAPKCAAPAPLKWWEQGPLYKIFLPAFKDGSDPQDGIGDLKGLESKLKYIESLGVKGISLSGILKTSSEKEESVEDFKLVNSTYGTLDQFKNLLTTLKEKGIQLLLSFVPNHTGNNHDWFIKSEQNDSVYRITTCGHLISEEGTSWTWSEVRKSFYLHQFLPDTPDLNFANSKVVDEFKSMFEFWIKLGVSGFELDKVEYLLEDRNLQDEVPAASTGTIHDEYDYYSHKKTTNLPGMIDILAEWRNAIRNYSSDAILSVAGKLSSDLFIENEDISQVADLFQTNTIFLHLKKDFTATDLNQLIQKYLNNHNKTRPVWQLSGFNSSRVTTRLSPDYVDGLHMVSMLLPGTPVTRYGEELGMEDAPDSHHPLMSWSNTTNAGFTTSFKAKYPTSSNYDIANVEAEEILSPSNLEVYKALVEARKAPSIMYGQTEYKELNNGTVFAFTRVKSGNPGYLVMLNTANVNIAVNLKEFKQVSEELNVQLHLHTEDEAAKTLKSKLQSDGVILPPKGALVVTFVPKQEEE